MKGLSHDILMRSIKMVDIGYIACIYIGFAMMCAKLTDVWFGEFNEILELQKPRTQLTVELIMTVWFYGIMIYVVRNVAGLIPFPLDGYKGFVHDRVKELKNATVFTFTYVLFSTFFREKIRFYYNTL
jgi:hypothetical protein